jgi:hypothetical protein
MSLTEAVREALAIRRRDDSAHQIQELVAKELGHLAPGARINRTGYFNHSWAPDLVVTPRHGEGRRSVFLRFDVRDASFYGDLDALAAAQPLFFDLVAANPEATKDEDDRIDLDEALARYEEGVLVTEIPAVETLDRSIDEDKGVREATQHVVIGGRGIVDPPAAERIVGSWRHATAAVAQASSGELRSALDEIESFLTEPTALDFESALRSQWVAAGQTAESFPGREQWNLEQREPWEIARLVLALIDDKQKVDQKRWVDIARSISMSTLGHELAKLGQTREGGAVNDLVRAALPYWTATYVYAPPAPAETMLKKFDWTVGTYSFGVNLSSCNAYFTDIGIKWNRVPRPNAMPNVHDYLERLGDATILGTGIQTSEEDMAVTLRPTATHSLKERVEQYVTSEEDAAWRQARVTTIDIRIPGTSAVATIDFKRSVVSTDQSVPLRTFVEIIGRYVALLDESEMGELMASLDGADATSASPRS